MAGDYGPSPVVALSGGIGGAKLALGLSRVLAAGQLIVVANTGDDFEHLGLAISPDLDTLMYTLADLDNLETGWGRRDETWAFMAAIEQLGGPTWFWLGDRDLATHVERTRRLRSGEALSHITAAMSDRLGIRSRLLPMSDDPVRTRLRTDCGWLDFQDYFVARRCEPNVAEIQFAGADTARPQADVLAVLQRQDLQAVLICPSNPLISIDPILAVPGLHDALIACTAPVVAISPIIGGKAVKGPTSKMMAELGMEPNSSAVARHYGDLLDGYVVEHEDEHEVCGLDLAITSSRTLMTTIAEKEALARVALDAAAGIRRSGRNRRGVKW